VCNLGLPLTISLQEVPGDFSVYEIVEKMRQQRPAMVQAKDQYAFVYSAVAELSRRSVGLNPTVPPKPSTVREWMEGRQLERGLVCAPVGPFY